MSRDRSRVSIASASEIRRPARHSVRNSSRVRGIRSYSYEGVNLVGLEVLRELLSCLLIVDVTTVAWDAGPWGGDSARRLWSAGLPRLDFPLACVRDTFSEQLSQFGGEVYKFKGWAQLRGPQKDGTFVPILLHLVQRPFSLHLPAIDEAEHLG